MSDFYQTGVVATFHRLGRINLEKIETELSWYANERPIALVLPSLYSELEGEALKGIVRHRDSAGNQICRKGYTVVGTHF